MARSIYSYLKTFQYYVRQMTVRGLDILLTKPLADPFQTPIIINNFNRLTFLRALIKRLEQYGYTNIYIIDNASSYPPLLEYYEQIPYKVFRLKKNVGHLSLWKTGIYKQFSNQYFVYTDSDVVPCENCPEDFMSHFYSLMKRFPRVSKVGFGLKIDDLPDTFNNKAKVIEWESTFWTQPIGEDIYRAPIDTTFALHRPRARGGSHSYDFVIRTGGRHMARHLPWYNDDSQLTEEELYYISSVKTSTHWASLQKG